MLIKEQVYWLNKISGSERNNFLYLERNDHGTKRPDTFWNVSRGFEAN